MTQENEAQLIDGLMRRDEGCFSVCVEAYQGLVFNTAVGLVQNAEDAEDISQEVFIEVYESIGSFKGQSKLSTWIYRIAVTKALEHSRSRHAKKRFAFLTSLFGFGEDSAAAFDIPDFNHPGVLLENKQRAAVLFKAIEQLPDNQKTAFTLHKLEGLSHEEIGEIMGSSLSSTESLMHRAKANLKKSLKTYYYGTEI